MINKETDLHAPVVHWLKCKGCKVKAEVRDVDLVGLINNEFLIAVELKKKLNLEVINQAVQRQDYADLTYIAVEHDFKAFESNRFKLTMKTIRRLGIGLITVNFRSDLPSVYELIKAKSTEGKALTKKAERERKKVLTEFMKRQVDDINLGGSTRQKIMTGYRENCLKIAWWLDKNQKSSTKELRESLPEIKNCVQILNQNHYQWFERVTRGVYQLTELGKSELVQNASIIQFFERQNHDEQI